MFQSNLSYLKHVTFLRPMYYIYVGSSGDGCVSGPEGARTT